MQGDLSHTRLSWAINSLTEGDVILGSVKSASAIGTVVERMTRFTLLLHLPEDHGALAVQEAIVAKMAQLPVILRKTLTWGQGSEMANHIAIAAAAELDIYFCDPHSPWQRGSNENINGLLRQCFANPLLHPPPETARVFLRRASIVR